MKNKLTHPTLTQLQSFVLAAIKETKRPVKREEIEFKIYQTRRNRNNDRAIQNAIRGLRMAGYVIVSKSDSAGYKLATTNAEVSRYVAERMKAAKEMIATAKRVEKAFKMRGQMKAW